MISLNNKYSMTLERGREVERERRKRQTEWIEKEARRERAREKEKEGGDVWTELQMPAAAHHGWPQLWCPEAWRVLVPTRPDLAVFLEETPSVALLALNLGLATIWALGWAGEAAQDAAPVGRPRISHCGVRAPPDLPSGTTSVTGIAGSSGSASEFVTSQSVTKVSSVG